MYDYDLNRDLDVIGERLPRRQALWRRLFQWLIGWVAGKRQIGH